MTEMRAIKSEILGISRTLIQNAGASTRKEVLRA
jgi:hypothetical protein